MSASRAGNNVKAMARSKTFFLMFNKLKCQKKKNKKIENTTRRERRPLARFTAHKHMDGLINVFTTPHTLILVASHSLHDYTTLSLSF